MLIQYPTQYAPQPWGLLKKPYIQSWIYLPQNAIFTRIQLVPNVGHFTSYMVPVSRFCVTLKALAISLTETMESFIVAPSLDVPPGTRHLRFL